MRSKKITIGTIIRVRYGVDVRDAKVRRIGERHNGYHMLTLDMGGEVAYAVAHEAELGH